MRLYELVLSCEDYPQFRLCVRVAGDRLGFAIYDAEAFYPRTKIGAIFSEDWLQTSVSLTSAGALCTWLAGAWRKKVGGRFVAPGEPLLVACERVGPNGVTYIGIGKEPESYTWLELGEREMLRLALYLCRVLDKAGLSLEPARPLRFGL